MVKMFRVGFAFFLALICVGSFASVSTVSPAWAVDAWTRVGSDIDGEAADDNSGSSASLSSDGSRVAIGAPSNDGGGSDAGQVRVYDLTGGGGGGGGITSTPRHLHFNKHTAVTRTLGWKFPRRLNGGSTTDYVIQYRVGGTTMWSTFTDGISTRRTVKVTGLTKKVKYQFQVAAHTSVGDSPYSKATRAS
jgi:hypothetical protein